MSAKEKTSQPCKESEDGTTKSKAHESIWQLNEPIDVDSYEPTVKHETLPFITKIESTSTLNNINDVSEKIYNALPLICRMLGANTQYSLELQRIQVRQKKMKVDHGLNLQSSEVKACKSIFIYPIPVWFEYVHVKAMIQLLTDFDVNCDTYYIDMITNSQNKKTGECLIRFIENKDCIQVFDCLHGIQLKKSLITVKLDINNEIGAGRDANSQCSDERFLKFKLRCEQQKEINGENLPGTGTISNIKVEMEQESTECEPNIKSEILNYSPDFETYESNLEVKREPIGTESVTAETSVNVKIEPSEELVNDVVEITDAPLTCTPWFQDHNFLNCKIVHIKNGHEICKNGDYFELFKSLIDKDVDFRLCKVTLDDYKTPSGDVIVSFMKHRAARKLLVKLKSFVHEGKKAEATMGIGYEMKSKLTVSDLKKFALKRKALYDDKEDSQPLAKLAKTESTSTHDSSENYMAGIMAPEDRCFEAHGLSSKFMKKLNVKVPLSRTVLVYKLHSDVTEAKLHEVFSLAGEVKRVTLTPDPASSQSKMAKVEFDHSLEAVQAISMFHKQKLYNNEMRLEMEPVSRQERPLPHGLSAIGPGLANSGLPLRGLRTLAESRLIYNMFVDLGLMEKTNNVDKPIKYTYKRCKSKDRYSLNSFSNKDSNPSSRNWSALDNNSSSKSSNNVSSSTGSKPTNATSNTTSKDTKSQDSDTPESNSLAIQALGTVMVTQGLIPSDTNCNSLHSILGALQKNAIANRRADEQNTKQNANANVPAQTQNPKNTNVAANKTDALNQAINQVMQFLPVHTGANVHSVLPANLQTGSANVPNMTVPNVPVLGNVPPHTAYINPPSRFDIGPANPAPFLLTPILNAPARGPMIPHPGPAPLLPMRPVGPRPLMSFNQEKPQNFPQNRPMPPVPNYDQNQMLRSNLIEVPLPSQKPAAPQCAKPAISGCSKDSPTVPNRNSSESDSNQSFKKSQMLVFKNLPSSVSTEALALKMREVGELKFCEMTGKGNAFVRFFKLADADRCIRLFHRSKVDGQVITVSFL